MSRPIYKTFLELRRRAWLVLLATGLVLASAFVLAKTVTTKYSAESVLVVQANGPLAGQPDASTRLAATYATLIPLDAHIRAALEGEVPGADGSGLSTTNDTNTAVLRIGFESSHAAGAIAGATAVARAISGPKPQTPTITPGTISIVRLPEEATSTRVSTVELLVAGGVLGGVLGLVLVAFWRARDRRIDDVRDLRKRVECQCLRLDPRVPESVETLIALLARRENDGVVALVPATQRECQMLQRVRDAIAPPLAAARISIAGVPGSEEVDELAAVGADVIVLVVSPGTRCTRVSESLDLLARWGALPSLAVLASRSRWPNRPPQEDAPDPIGASRTAV